MTVYDLVLNAEQDYDVADTVFDITVCCCAMDESDIISDEPYDKFCVALYNKVKINKRETEKYGKPIASWTGFIEKNRKLFEDFMHENWICDYKYDNFCYEWIKEFHMLLAGYGTDSVYEQYVELFDKTKI